MRRVLLLVSALALFVSACGGAAATATGSVDLVAPSAAADVISDAPTGLVVLDIRTPQEFNAGALPDAVNIDFYEADFRNRLANLDKDVPYVMYCNSGNRSATAADLMEELGFTEVYEIDGGIQAWAQSGGALALP
jgi:rhodanese-related sulfurtransferase